MGVVGGAKGHGGSWNDGGGCGCVVDDVAAAPW